MIKINLLAEGKRPAAVRKSREQATSFLQSEQAAAILLAASLLLLGLLPAGVWWWVKSHEIEDNDEAIAEAQREVDELAAIIKEVEEYKARQVELQSKITVIEQLRRNQRGPVHVMDSISSALPELLWLDSMGMTATAITLSGRAFNTNAVASFVENLDNVPEFQEPDLRDLARGRGGGVYNFTVVFQYRYPDLVDEVDEVDGDDLDGGLATEASAAEAAGG